MNFVSASFLMSSRSGSLTCLSLSGTQSCLLCFFSFLFMLLLHSLNLFSCSYSLFPHFLFFFLIQLLIFYPIFPSKIQHVTGNVENVFPNLKDKKNTTFFKIAIPSKTYVKHLLWVFFFFFLFKLGLYICDKGRRKVQFLASSFYCLSECSWRVAKFVLRLFANEHSLRLIFKTACLLTSLWQLYSHAAGGH